MHAWQQRIESYHGKPCNYFITDISEFPPHWHKELEIVYVLGEELKVGLNGEVHALGTGDLFIFSAGDIHHFPNQVPKCRRIILQFDPAALDRDGLFRDRRIARPRLARSGTEHPLAADLAAAHDLVECDILEIGEELAARREGFLLAIQARLYDLMLHILRHVPMEDITLEQRSRQTESLKRLDSVFQFVDAHFQEELYLEEVAAAASYSVFHFTRFFKQTTGMTFFEYLNKLRIAKAAALLESSTLPITEVAFKTGFSSIKTFNRLFRQIQGCAPLHYRNSNIREE